MLLRRALAVTALAVVIVGVALVVTRGGDDSPTAAAPTPAATPTPRRHRHRAKPRPAIPAAPAQVSGAAARRMAVPILMYHVVSAPPPGTPNAELWVDRHVFADEMAALKKAGYWAITLKQAFAAWDHGGPLPRHPIVVSFDDGYLSDYTHAKPVLHRLGWPGVLNLQLNVIGPGGLTTKQIKSMLKVGWEVDSHTMTHPDLTTVSDAQLRTELVDSRKQLRARFGVPADFFAYPAGKYDAHVVAAVKAAGYKGATTTDPGFGTRSDPFTLPRVRVNGSDTPQSLLARLRNQ
jgi:peptidoglycan/xylan/chitin deacetylase (PgdA/CDA1 family)